MRVGLAALSAALCLSTALPASAMVIIGTGAGTVQPDENVLFNNNPPDGLTVQGVTNKSGSGVSITGGETLAASGGQARVGSADGAIDTTFTFDGLGGQILGFGLTDPAKAFDTAEFRLFGGTATQATLTFIDTAGQQFQSTFDIPSNGFFNAQATAGEQISTFSIAANGSVGDVRQIRLGGISAIFGLPEPASWALMILGIGGVGANLRRARRASRALA